MSIQISVNVKKERRRVIMRPFFLWLLYFLRQIDCGV